VGLKKQLFKSETVFKPEENRLKHKNRARKPGFYNLNTSGRSANAH